MATILIKERSSDIGMSDNPLSIESVRVYPKDITKMQKAELKIEQTAFLWLSSKLEELTRYNSMRLYHLREHYPIDEDTREKVIEDYENGLITMGERKIRMKKITMREKEHAQVEARMILAQRTADHFRSMHVVLGEELDRINSYERYDPAQKTLRTARRHANKYNPRKRESLYNRAPWRKELPEKTLDKKKIRPQRKLSNIHTKWKKSTLYDYRFEKMQARTDELSTFNLESLRRIGYDRGYITNLTLEAAIAEQLGMTVESVRVLLCNGKLKWEVIFIIADMLEMTPAEFCDTFLNGLFRETVPGKWTAVLPDNFTPEEYRKKNKKATEQRPIDDSAFEIEEEDEAVYEDDDDCTDDEQEVS